MRISGKVLEPHDQQTVFVTGADDGTAAQVLGQRNATALVGKRHHQALSILEKIEVALVEKRRGNR